MHERFGSDVWDHESADVPVLRDSLVSLVGRIAGQSSRGSHSVWFVEIDHVIVHGETDGLSYFQRQFHRISATPRAVEC